VRLDLHRAPAASCALGLADRSPLKVHALPSACAAHFRSRTWSILPSDCGDSLRPTRAKLRAGPSSAHSANSPSVRQVVFRFRNFQCPLICSSMRRSSLHQIDSRIQKGLICTASGVAFEYKLSAGSQLVRRASPDLDHHFVRLSLAGRVYRIVSLKPKAHSERVFNRQIPWTNIQSGTTPKFSKVVKIFRHVRLCQALPLSRAACLQ